MTVMYDAASLGTFGTIFKWRGSMLPLVLKKPIFYILLLIHICFLLIREMLFADDSSLMPVLDWKSVTMLTGLLTFFIVFYGSQCYGRMNTFYGLCVGLGGACMNWAALVRISLPQDRAMQWNAMRLVLASMHIMYYLLSEDENENGKQLSEQNWRVIRARELLSADEIETIKAFRGFRPFLPLIWALKEVEDALVGACADEKYKHREALEKYRLSDLLSNFRELAFTFRGQCGHLKSWLEQPVPFPYYQFLTMLFLLDMLIVAYGLVTLHFNPGLTVLIFITILTAFLGLKEVAVAMSNPFGDDAIDFDTEPMLKRAYDNAVAILHDEREVCGSELRGGLRTPTAAAAVAPPARAEAVGVTQLASGPGSSSMKSGSMRPAAPLVKDYPGGSSDAKV